MNAYDAFGVDRPDLVSKRVLRMNSSEKKELGAGAALSVGGIGATVGGMHLDEKGRTEHHHSMIQGRRAAESYKSAVKEHGRPSPNVWHAKGTEHHAAAGKIMRSLDSANEAKAGIRSAKVMRRVGVPLAVGGLAAGGVGSVLLNHSVARWGERNQRERMRVNRQRQAARATFHPKKAG